MNEEFYTIGQLKALIKDLPDSRLIACQVLATNGQVWNMRGKFTGCVPQGEIACLTFDHPDLESLNSMILNKVEEKVDDSYTIENEEFKYLAMVKPPINVDIIIHTIHGEMLLAYACRTYFGYDFLILDTKKWIGENDVLGWRMAGKKYDRE